MSDHSRLAEAWVRRFEALRDADLRVGYARHELGRLTADALVELLAELAAGAERGSSKHRDLLQTLFVALAAPSLHPLRRDAAARADDGGELEIARVLAVPSPRTEPAGVAEPRGAHDARGGRPLTLGERKSLARGRDRQALARALRDPHPGVTRILLENPSLTEDDVVRLCATRPIAPETLREVFQQRRWSARYGVQLALVKNPACPLDVAVQLASQLRRKDAREVAAAEDLRTEVRQAALRVDPGRTIH
jgi:hypothetical protein